MRLAIDFLALGILLGGLLLFSLFKIFLTLQSEVPSLAFSRLKDLHMTSWRSRLASSLGQWHLATLLCFMIAFIDPHFLSPKPSSSLPHPPESTQGLAIYLVLDQSGSMNQIIVSNEESDTSPLLSRIDLLKQVTEQFILDHPSDLMGIVAFARVPKVLVPLTLDQSVLLKALHDLRVVKHPDEDGTAIGYAIFKTANIIHATRQFAKEEKANTPPPYDIKGSVMIVVTDGFQNPSRLDQGNRLRTMELDDAAAYAKKEKIHLYVINIDPEFALEKYAPERRQLETITRETGGEFFLVKDPHDLSSIYQSIGRLEKGTISPTMNPMKDEKLVEQRFSLYPFFLGLGLLGLFAVLFLELWIVRKVP